MLERISGSHSVTSSDSATLFTSNTSFLKKSYPCTLADIASGSIRHINLSRVTKLEQQLSRLYGELHSYLTHFKSTPEPILSLDKSKSLLRSLDKASVELLDLSFLVPNVPWSSSYSLPELTVDDIMLALPKLAHSKQQNVKDLLTSALKLAEYRYRLLQNKIEHLELDLKHQSSEKQKSKLHIQSLSRGLFSEFETYHDSIKESLVLPLKNLLKKFTNLSEAPTDENLKVFLNDFKQESTTLEDICHTIEAHELDEQSVKKIDDQFSAQLKKLMKNLKLQKMKLEDEENYYMQLEREMKDEVDSRVSQLALNKAPVSKSLGGKKGGSLGKPTQLTSKLKVQPSKAANAFLTKYDVVEKQSQVQKADDSKSSSKS